MAQKREFCVSFSGLVICGSNLAYLQCGPHPCTPPAAIRDWNSFHHDWNLLEFFPILSNSFHPLPAANTTGCHEKPFSTRSYYRFFRSFSLHGVHNLHGVLIWHICSVDLIRVLRLQQFVIGILSTTIGIYWNSFQFFPPTVWSVTICMEYTICMECTVLNSIA